MVTGQAPVTLELKKNPRKNKNKSKGITYKNKIHSSSEIKYFVEIHLWKLCVTLRLRVLPVVSFFKIKVGISPCNYNVAVRFNRVMLVSLCAVTTKPVF